MFGINEILNKLIKKKPLTERDKFLLLRQRKNIAGETAVYLAEILKDIYIEVTCMHKGTLFELMGRGELEGWCWQTTESIIVFFNDDDYIERGNLYFDDNCPKYYHSWIVFKYKGEEYVLDPCFNFLCKKKLYHQLFLPDIKGRVSAKEVRDELIEQVKNAPKDVDKSNDSSSFISFLKMVMSEEAYLKMCEDKKGEVEVTSCEDVNAPLFRNSSGYKLEIEDNKIKKMKVHYYDTDC